MYAGGGGGGGEGGWLSSDPRERWVTSDPRHWGRWLTSDPRWGEEGVVDL